MTQTQRTVLISCGLLIGFTTLIFTGEGRTFAINPTAVWHEWLGLTVGAILAVHIGLYWTLLFQTMKRFWLLPWNRKGFLLMNAAILLFSGLTIISGIAISPWLGFGAMESEWRHLHHVVPKLTLLLVLVHVILRWKKIRNVLLRNGKRESVPALENGENI